MTPPYVVENEQGAIAVVESSKNVAEAVAGLYDNAGYRKISRKEARDIRRDLMERRERIMGKAYEGETILERMIGSCA